MRYLGQLGVAAQVAARAGSDQRATTGRPDADPAGAPPLTDERAAAWHAWAHAPTRDGRSPEVPTRDAPTREAQPREARPRSFQPGSGDGVRSAARSMPLSRDPGQVSPCGGRPADLRPGDEPTAVVDLLPARGRFIEWIAQVVADAEHTRTATSSQSSEDAPPAIDDDAALSDAGARSPGTGRLSMSLAG